MAWDKDYILITMRDSATGELDETAYTVEMQPTDQAYPTGKTACTQLSSLHTYKPNSDLDEDKHYWVYVGGSALYKLIALNSEPAVGG